MDLVHDMDFNGNVQFGCAHCFWMQDPMVAWETIVQCEVVHEVIDESHFSIRVARCGLCEQRFIIIFCETIDYADGDDPQHWIILPVTNSELEALISAAAADFGLIRAFGEARRQLLIDHPKGGPVRADWWGGPLLIPPHG